MHSRIPSRSASPVVFFVVLVAAVLAAPRDSRSGPAQGPRKATASRDGWPRTNAGELARGWVEAFGRGEPAMREYLARNLAEQSLASKPLDERLETYRKNRERFGKLMLASVVSSAAGELRVKLLTSDGATQTFVFKVQGRKPYNLLSIGILEARHLHGDGGVHHP